MERFFASDSSNKLGTGYLYLLFMDKSLSFVSSLMNYGLGYPKLLNSYMQLLFGEHFEQQIPVYSQSSYHKVYPNSQRKARNYQETDGKTLETDSNLETDGKTL